MLQRDISSCTTRSICQAQPHAVAQVLHRRAAAVRCDSSNPLSSQRVSSNQSASCSGRQWLSAGDINAGQNPIACNANLKESDLQLPKADGSGNDGPGNFGGNGSSGGNGGGGGGGEDDDDDDDKLLNSVEVSPPCFC